MTQSSDVSEVKSSSGRRWIIVAVSAVLALGVTGSAVVRHLLLERARTDLAAEFDRRAGTALASVSEDIERYRANLAIIASFTGYMTTLSPQAWNGFVTDTGMLSLDSNRAVAHLSVVRPGDLAPYLAQEKAVGLPGTAPLALPQRMLGTSPLYVLDRIVSGKADFSDLGTADLGSLPSLRATLDAAVATGEIQVVSFRKAVADATALSAQLQVFGLDPGTGARVLSVLAPNARSLDDLGFGLAVPVRSGTDGPVTAVVLAGTLPIDGVARIDATSGGDLRVTLAAQHGGTELIYFHGEPPAPQTRTRSVEGSFSGIEWVASVAATPAFERRLDTSGADVSAAVLLGLAVVGAALLVVRHRLAVRADAAAAQVADAEQRAGRDPLTGLLNRAGLDRSIRTLATEPLGRAAVIFVDLDGLKAVNDSLGHEAGDRLITEAAQRLQSLARADDLIARQGGDEFVIVAPGLDADDDARRTAMRILDAFVAPVPGLEHAPVVGIGASIGVAVANCDRIPDAIARADAAMYAAKQAGGTRVLVDGDPVPAPDPARADAAARRTR